MESPGLPSTIRQFWELCTTRLAGFGALQAHFRALLAAILTAFLARLRALPAELFAELANSVVVVVVLFAGVGTDQAHVMASFAHFAAFGSILLATNTAVLAFRGAFAAGLGTVRERFFILCEQTTVTNG